MGRASSKKKVGRQFEELITRLESSQLPGGAIVTSPDKILDRASGNMREVDASIRYRIGTIPMLITIECRDRSRAAEPGWIDELVSKRDDIGAHLSIGVSAKGFSKPARQKAKVHGIVLRTINELTVADILQITPALSQLKVHIEDVEVHYETEDPTSSMILCLDGSPFVTNKPFIREITSGKEFSLDEFFDFLSTTHTIAWPAYSDTVSKKLVVRFSRNAVFEIRTNNGFSKLASLETTFKGGAIMHAFELGRAFNYVDDDQNRLMQFQNWGIKINHQGEIVEVGMELLLK